MHPQKIRRNPSTPATSEKDVDKLNLWNRHGLEDVYFQRESQVNFFSIMGGVAAAALLTQFFPLLEQVRLSRWHLILYFAASILLLVYAWTMTSWGTLVLRWRISYPIILPHYIILICLSIMCLLVTNPAGWTLAVGCSVLTRFLHQLIFYRSGSWARYSPENQKRQKNLLLLDFLVFLIAASASAQMAFLPSKASETIWGFLALFLTVALMSVHQRSIDQERKYFSIP